MWPVPSSSAWLAIDGACVAGPVDNDTPRVTSRYAPRGGSRKLRVEGQRPVSSGMAGDDRTLESGRNDPCWPGPRVAGRCAGQGAVVQRGAIPLYSGSQVPGPRQRAQCQHAASPQCRLESRLRREGSIVHQAQKRRFMTFAGHVARLGENLLVSQSHVPSQPWRGEDDTGHDRR